MQVWRVSHILLSLPGRFRLWWLHGCAFAKKMRCFISGNGFLSGAAIPWEKFCGLLSPMVWKTVYSSWWRWLLAALWLFLELIRLRLTEWHKVSGLWQHWQVWQWGRYLSQWSDSVWETEIRKEQTIISKSWRGLRSWFLRHGTW